MSFLANLCFAAVPASANEVEAAFKTRCGECHGPHDIARWGRERPDPTSRQAWLERYLRRHYAPLDAERALIIRHIQSVLARGDAPR
ncbi:MAG: hypothetical protein U1E97_03445 [Alphaproteobacteria bacterium]